MILSISSKLVSSYGHPKEGFSENHEDLLATIDAIEHGDAPWRAFTIRYTGAITADSPEWKQQSYTV